MSRNILSIANTDTKTHTIRGAKILEGREWTQTSDESTTKNRVVYYDVDCKTCNVSYTKSKAALLKTHTCPKCFSEQEATAPKKTAKKILTVALFLSDYEFIVYAGSQEKAEENLNETDLSRWKSNGRKAAQSDESGRFTLKPLLTTSVTQAECQPLAAQTEPLKEWQPTKENPIPYAGVPPAVNWAEPINLQRTDEQERDTIDCEGFHRDLRRQQEFCNLFPHSPKRKTFSGWLISQANLERLQNKQIPYTDSQLIEKKAGVKDIQNDFEGAPLAYFAQAAAKVNGCRGWLYLYEYHEEFDPVVHRLPVDELIKADLTGLSRAKETYRQWHLKKLAEETKAQEAQ